MSPEIQNKLRQMLIDWDKPDWDWDGAYPIGIAVIAKTIKLLEKLPEDIPEPELVPEPNGCLTLVWRANNKYNDYVMLTTRDDVYKFVQMTASNPKYYDHNAYSFFPSIPKNMIEAIREIIKKSETIS
jgi:hypothetical protein